MEGPTRLDVFREAVDAVFAQWTLLNLAVEQGWGGSDSAQKRQKLYEDVIQTFVTEKKVEPEPLADVLADRLSSEFNVDVEDESDLEVARLLVELAEQTQRGCFDLARHVKQQLQMQRERQPSTARSTRLLASGEAPGIMELIHRGVPMRSSESSSESDYDGDGCGEEEGNCGNDGNAAPSDKGAADGLTRNASRTDADADGWISVQRRGKRAM